MEMFDVGDVNVTDAGSYFCQLIRLMLYKGREQKFIYGGDGVSHPFLPFPLSFARIGPSNPAKEFGERYSFPQQRENDICSHHTDTFPEL